MKSKGVDSLFFVLLLLSVLLYGNAFSSIHSPIHSAKVVGAPLKNSASNEDAQPQESLRGGADQNATVPVTSMPSTLSAVPPLPSLVDFRKFALPCLGVWVSGPLLSLVDTAFVGLSSSAAQSSQQLASLGPATTFFDGATYLFAFLNVATTNLYSSALAQHGEDSDQAEDVVRTASRVAFNFGLGLMIFCLAYCKPLIALYIGEPAVSNPQLLKSATDYVKIRALSMPTTLILGVIQAALLGAKDSVTPLIAIAYSTIINIVGDFILVNRLKMGLQGAAIATLVAQWVATAALVGPGRRKLVRDRNLGILKKVKGSIPGRTFLAFALPVLTLILGKMSAFGFMTHSAAAVPGQPIPLATHQIILSLFFFVSPFLEVLSQTAQTFLPPYLAPVNDHISKMKESFANYMPEKDGDVQKWMSTSFAVATRLLAIGMVIGVAIASTASLIPAFLGGMITTDKTVQQGVKPLAKYLWVGAFLTAPVAISEGVLLARRELGFLASIYVVSTALLPWALLRVKHIGGNVAQVWSCFAVFQLFRATCFTGKVWGGWLVSTIKKKFINTTQATPAKAI